MTIYGVEQDEVLKIRRLADSLGGMKALENAIEILDNDRKSNLFIKLTEYLCYDVQQRTSIADCRDHVHVILKMLGSSRDEL